MMNKDAFDAVSSYLKQSYDLDFRKRVRQLEPEALQSFNISVPENSDQWDIKVFTCTADTLYIAMPYTNSTGDDVLSTINAAGSAGSAGTIGSLGSASTLSSTSCPVSCIVSSAATASSVGCAGSKSG